MVPSRLAAAAALSLFASAGASQVPAIQTIQLYSYGYQPDPIVLAAGRPVTLTFVNSAGKGHDFTAEKFFRASRIVESAAPGGEIDLGRGQSRSITLIPTAGRYKVHCGKPFHKLMGMSADIIVR